LAPAKDGVGLDGIAFGADGNLYVTTYIPAALFKITVKDGKAGAVTALRSSRPLDHADAMRGFGDSLLLIEGNGKLDKITIKGDDAEIETIKDGFTEPVSVTQVGDTAWVAEGKLSYIRKDPGPFTLKPFSLSKYGAIGKELWARFRPTGVDNSESHLSVKDSLRIPARAAARSRNILASLRANREWV
jgi:hypothetical protein